MTLTEYLKEYRKRNISKLEASIFGLPDTKAGWKVRYGEYEITTEMLERYSSVGAPTKQKTKVRRKLVDEIHKLVKWETTNEQLLYLMVNPIGNFKIGISKDPSVRSKTLSNASGMMIKLLGVWCVDKNVRQVETKLHKKAQACRLEGEWFKPGKVSVSWVEEKLIEMDCGFTLIQKW